MRPMAVAFALAALAPAAKAETAALLAATGVNVPAETLAAAQDVFFGHLLATRRWAVQVVAGPSPAGGWAPASAAEQARSHGADLAVALHLTRLDGTTRARISAFRAADGQMIWFDEAAASQPADLDGALRRLARAMASGRPAAEASYPLAAPPYPQPPPPPPAYPPAPGYAPPYPPPPAAHGPGYAPPYPPTAAAQAGEGRPRRRAEQIFGLAFLGGWAQGAPRVQVGAGSAQGLGAFWLYDTRVVLASLNLSYLGGANHQAAFGMGVHVPLVPGDITPYAGGGLGYTWSRWWDASRWSSGFTPYLGGGVLLGREWNVQVRAELSFFYNLYLSRNAGGEFHGQGFLGSIGMGF